MFRLSALKETILRWLMPAAGQHADPRETGSWAALEEETGAATAPFDAESSWPEHEEWCGDPAWGRPVETCTCATPPSGPRRADETIIDGSLDKWSGPVVRPYARGEFTDAA